MNEFSKTPYRLAKMNTPVLYIVRHGSTGDDEAFNSPRDPQLDSIGKKEADALAKYFSDKKVGDVISSKLHRAVDTGKIIGDKIGKTPAVNPNIDSLNVGDVANMTSEEEADKVVKHHQDNPDETIPGGESISDFEKRTRPVFTENIQKFFQTGEPSVLVAHHSLQYEAGKTFNNDKDSAITKPGGVTAIYQVSPGKFEAIPVFKPE